MPNRLAGETSPYLLQHANNPVDWYPWGPEALQKAKDEDKPIFLSIGYSACHWCHVMEHESFENPKTAAIMNERFVNIKVDREERPDLDSIYMEAVQAMTQHGGWPMSVFLTPDGVPFYGGTYFPPEPRHGMMGFPQVLQTVSEAFKEKRDQIHEGSEQMKQYLQQSGTLRPARSEPDVGILDAAARTLAGQIDRVQGGTQGAPKFPQPMALEFMLRYYHRTGDRNILALAELTLEKMARGGIYDQLGGGFHRYSVDDRWLVPHFEKMLYDNALLARVYLGAFQLTKNELYARIAQETLDYVMREMVSPEGGFYSTQDADSEGVEGKFYVWTPAEVVDVLGPEEGKLFNLLYDVSQRGNFEGHNILNLPRTPGTVAAVAGVPEERINEIASEGRRKLYEARSKRIWPGRDEKVLVGWNGLMLRAFAEAASVLDREDYRRTAIRNAEFVLSTLVQKEEVPEGEVRLFRTYKDGKAHIDAFAEDYAFYAAGLLSLYETTFEPRWIETARALMDTLLAHFADSSGGFFTTADFHENLVARPKELYDNAIPSANSVGAEALLRLYLFTTEPEYEQRALQTMQPLMDVLGKAPTAFGQMLCALDLYLGPSAEVAIIGELRAGDMMEMLRAVWQPYVPNKVVAAAEGEDEEAARIVPLLADRPQVDGKATAYVCRNYICEAPTTDPVEVARLLTNRAKQSSI
ncbi:MAG TPA: thioredoxin domain-containing protein [Chloroflexia bacterium]|nr:thioredoxin domain-containing protein [Chloroflexia bacterium]